MCFVHAVHACGACVRCVLAVCAFVWVYMCAFMYVCMHIICVLRCKVVGSDTTTKSLQSGSEPLNSHLRYVMAMLNVSKLCLCSV